MTAKAEKLEKIIQELRHLPTVIDTVLLSRNGIIIAPGKDKNAHAKRFAILCATIDGAAGAALSQFYTVGPQSVVVRGKECVLVIVDAGPKAILMVLNESDEYVEELLVLAEMKAGRIKALLI